jgi:hypothetical protein
MEGVRGPGVSRWSRLSRSGYSNESGPQTGRVDCLGRDHQNPPLERTEYRFECIVRRQPQGAYDLATEVNTTWTFFTEHPGDRQSQQPLLDLDYELDVDWRNSARERSETDLELELQRGAERVSAADLDAWVSFDDGATWRDLRVRRGEAEIDNSRRPGYVSLRVRADDAAGESIDQTIIRAYRVRDGGDEDDDDD